MLIEELTSQLKLKADYEQAKEAALAEEKKKEKKDPPSDPSLCPTCHFAKILCECEDEDEDDDEEDEDFEVTQEEWDEAVKLTYDALDSLDRILEDDRVVIPEGMKFLLMSRRIDLWDFLAEHATEEMIAERSGDHIQSQAEFMRELGDEENKK